MTSLELWIGMVYFILYLYKFFKIVHFFFWSLSTERLLDDILLDRLDHLISTSKVGTLAAYDFEVNDNSCYFWFIKHSRSWTSGHSYHMDMQVINSQPLQSQLCALQPASSHPSKDCLMEQMAAAHSPVGQLWGKRMRAGFPNYALPMETLETIWSSDLNSKNLETTASSKLQA